jgi:hypothetical protein
VKFKLTHCKNQEEEQQSAVKYLTYYVYTNKLTVYNVPQIQVSRTFLRLSVKVLSSILLYFS